MTQTEQAKDLADRLDEALALVPASPEGADIFLGDIILLGVEISDFLRSLAEKIKTKSS